MTSLQAISSKEILSLIENADELGWDVEESEDSVTITSTFFIFKWLLNKKDGNYYQQPTRDFS